MTAPRRWACGALAVATLAARPAPSAPSSTPGGVETLFALGEEHHEALAHWLEASAEGLLDTPPYTILHVDSHADFGAPASLADRDRWQEVMLHTSINNFLPMAAWLGLTDDIVYLAPPWEWQCRHAYMERPLELIVGEVRGGLKFALKAQKGDTPMLQVSIRSLLEGQVIPWKRRSELRRPARLRFRTVAAEQAIPFLQDGGLFEGQNHTRYLLDFDMDALSTTSPRALELQGRGFDERAFGRLHRLHNAMADELVSLFRHALAQGAAPSAGAAKLRGVKAAYVLATKVIAEATVAEGRDVLEKLAPVLGALTSQCRGCERALEALVLENANRLQSLAEELPGGMQQIVAIMEDALTQPYQVSTWQEIRILVRFWERAFLELPVPPAMVTAVRSPFYSPRETVRFQECELLGAFQRLWPTATNASALRTGQHFEAWHTSCAEVAVASWRSHSVGHFEGASASKGKWQLATPERVHEEFGPAGGHHWHREL